MPGLIDLRMFRYNRRLYNQITSYFSRNAGENANDGPWTLCRALRLGCTPLPPNEADWGTHHVGPLRIMECQGYRYGVFATEDIPAGAFIIAVRGSLVSMTAPMTALERMNTWIPSIDAPVYCISQVNPAKSNITRFLWSSVGTHMPDGNVEVVWQCGFKVAIIRASRDIPANTELVCPYNMPEVIEID